jgi:hypothetical protein
LTWFCAPQSTEAKSKTFVVTEFAERNCVLYVHRVVLDAEVN